MLNVVIKKGTIDHILSVNKNIPEFSVYFTREDFQKKLGGENSLILIAFNGDIPIAFMAGWIDIYNELYEVWVAGVHKDYRGHGIADLLLSSTESWVRSKNINRIIADVNQRNMGMVIKHLKNGYYITGIKFNKSASTSKVFFEKLLD